MRVATLANTRTSAAARHSIVEALSVAFKGGSVMGMCVVGLGIIGLSMLFLVYSNVLGATPDMVRTKVLAVLAGFSLGASSGSTPPVDSATPTERSTVERPAA